jgi:acyl carrier protein
MSQTDIYYKIRRILSFNFGIDDQGNLFNANLYNNLGLNTWEVNLLLYHIEQTFSIKLREDLELEVFSLNQLVKHVSGEISRQKPAC